MPTKDDVFIDDQCCIKVNPSGGYFHLYNKGDVQEIKLHDIAAATSRQCRFTGHLLDGIEIYSVAEHCILVSAILEAMGCPPDVVFQGLMHDACEAYLSDIAAPFKGELGSYHECEHLIWQRIALKYNLPTKLDPRVKVADWYALFVEARQIVTRDEKDLSTWQGYETYGEDSKQYMLQLNAWLPSEARKQFMCRFADCLDKLYHYLDEACEAAMEPEQLELDLG